MNAKELQIGDWVFLNGKPMRVACLLNGKFVNCGEPIPITEEILKENGFKEVYKSTFQTIYILQLPMGGDFLEYVFLACSDNCFKIFLYGVEREKTYINYVHELQHALRLCGLNELADNFKV